MYGNPEMFHKNLSPWGFFYVDQKNILLDVHLSSIVTFGRSPRIVCRPRLLGVTRFNLS